MLLIQLLSLYPFFSGSPKSILRTRTSDLLHYRNRVKSPYLLIASSSSIGEGLVPATVVSSTSAGAA